MSKSEKLPSEANDLARAVSGLIDARPENRRAIAELASLLGVDQARSAAAFPVFVASMRLFLERLEARSTSALPGPEQALWEDAGARFNGEPIERGQVTVAFADLLSRSVDGDTRVAERLRVDRSRISQRVRESSLYAFNRSETRYFPDWQFIGRSTLPGLREVLSVLDVGLHPLVVDHWFTTPSVDLEIGDENVSPVMWLATSGNPQVILPFAAEL